MPAQEWMIRYGAQLGVGLVAAAGVVGAWLPRARVLRASRPETTPTRPASERREGGLAEIEGVVRVVDGPCTRVEDNAPAAAVTFSPPYEGPLPRQDRAGTLALETQGETVPLLGPVEVVVGSLEWWPGSLPRWWPSRPQPPGNPLRALARLLSQQDIVFRSVRDGDRVRVVGVWTRDSASDGYRASGGWCLTPVTGRIGGPPPALSVGAVGPREVRGPGLGLWLAGALLGAVVAALALAGAGRAALGSDAPHLALATPWRGRAIERLGRSLSAPIRKTQAERSLAAALREGQGCRERGHALYGQGSVREAAEVWSGCYGARRLAAEALYELTEWGRASELLDATATEGEKLTVEGAALEMEIHVLAGQPGRASARAGFDALDEPPPRELYCALVTLGVQRGDQTVPACQCAFAPLLLAPRASDQERLRAERDYLARTYRATPPGSPRARDTRPPEGCVDAGGIPLFHVSPSAPRVHENALINLALSPQSQSMSWPVGLLLHTAPALAEEELFQGHPDTLRQRLEALGSQAERLAIYSLLAGRNDDARSWAQRARMADEQIERYAPGRLIGGQLMVAMVDMNEDRFLDAEHSLTSHHDHPIAALARFLGGNNSHLTLPHLQTSNNTQRSGILDVLSRIEDGCEASEVRGKTRWVPREVIGSLPSGSRLARRFDCASAQAYAYLPALSARVHHDHHEVLRLFEEAPREMRPRTLLDLMAEAHGEITLRRRLGLPDPQRKAELRRQRIDEKLRDRDLAVALDLLEAARRGRSPWLR